MDINHSCVDPSVCVATISFRFYNSFWLKLIYATSFKSFVKLKYTNLLLKAKILSLVTMLSSRLFHSFMHLIENKNLFRVLCTRVFLVLLIYGPLYYIVIKLEEPLSINIVKTIYNFEFIFFIYNFEKLNLVISPYSKVGRINSLSRCSHD